MIQTKWVFGANESQDAYDIRRQVFIGELGHNEELHFDQHDRAALHVLVGEGDTWLATGRLYDADGQFNIGPIAVLPAIRGKKVGDLVVRLLLDKCFELLADEVHVPARECAVGFYEKLNFTVCGDAYEREPGDVRIPMKVTQADSPLQSHDCSSCGGGCGGCGGHH